MFGWFLSGFLDVKGSRLVWFQGLESRAKGCQDADGGGFSAEGAARLAQQEHEEARGTAGGGSEAYLTAILDDECGISLQNSLFLDDLYGICH